MKDNLWATGNNSYGQLGVGHKENVKVLTKVMSGVKKVSCGGHSAAITQLGELYVWGTGIFGEILTPRKIVIIDKMIDVSIGKTFGVVLDNNNRVWTWGSNSVGELGLGDYESRNNPVIISKLSSKFITKIACGSTFAFALSQSKAKEGLSVGLNSLVEDSPNKLIDTKQSEVCITNLRNYNDIQSIDGTSLNETLVSSLSQLNPQKSLLKVLERERDYFEEFLERTKEEKKELEQEVKKLTNEYRSIKDTIEVERKKKEADFDNLLSLYTLCKQKVDEMESRMEMLEEENKILSSRLEEIIRERDKLIEKCNKSKEKIKGHIEAEYRLATESEEAHNDIKTLLNKLKEYENKVKKLQVQIIKYEKLEEENIILKESNEKSKESNTELNDQCNQLKSLLTNIESAMNKLQEDAKTSKEQINNLLKENTQLKAKTLIDEERLGKVTDMLVQLEKQNRELTEKCFILTYKETDVSPIQEHSNSVKREKTVLIEKNNNRTLKANKSQSPTKITRQRDDKCKAKKRMTRLQKIEQRLRTSLTKL